MGKEKSLRINGTAISPGSNSVVNINQARLPSGTDIDLPVSVFRASKPGPIVLLSGGLHGDEINGMEIVRGLIDEGLLNKLDKGTVIAIPVMNIYGFLNFSRDVVEGKDLNRSFPGNRNGSLAYRVANFFTKDILNKIDCGVDFHTGGASRFNFPQIRYYAKDQKAASLAKGFGAPVTLQSGLIDKSIRKQAHKMKKPLLVFEGGESLRLDMEVVEEGKNGALRLLNHLNMLKVGHQAQVGSTISLTGSTWIRAKLSGLYTPYLKAGMNVAKGDLLGTIQDPFGQFKADVKAHRTGFIVGHNNMPVVNQGDALVHLGIN